jgi:cytidine deaminase
LADRLQEAAWEARKQAWCPYSGFAVGAALESDDGRWFAGCNVENASYGLTVCAERAAVSAAIAAGARRFRRIVVVAELDPPVPPCGACRQVLMEFAPELVVESANRTTRHTWQLRELLPDAFAASRRPHD